MLHPLLDVSKFNVVLSVISGYSIQSRACYFTDTLEGLYILLFGFISLQIKQRWYLGEACMFLCSELGSAAN